MDNKVLFAFNVREKTKPGPKKIVVSKKEIIKIKNSRRVLENKIVISPYEIKDNYNHVPNYDYTEVNDDYCFVNARLLEPILPNLNKIALRVVWHLAFLLQPNSNVVKFPMDLINQIHGSKYSGYTWSSIKKLEEYNIINRTNRQSYYVVNHNLFFKGNLKEFATKYKELYGDKQCMFTKKGYVVIDDDFTADIVQKEKEIIKTNNDLKD